MNIRRLALLTLGLLAAVLIAVTISHIFGRNWVIETDVQLSWGAASIINLITYSISTAVTIGFCLQCKIGAIKRVTAITLIAALAVYLFLGIFELYVFANAIIQYAIPLMSVLYVTVRHENKMIAKALINIAVWHSFSFVFSVLTIAIRTYIKNPFIYAAGQWDKSVFGATVDILIFSVILYIAGGEYIAKTARATAKRFKAFISSIRFYSVRNRRHFVYDGYGEGKNHLGDEKLETTFHKLRFYFNFYSWRTWEFWKGILIMLFQFLVIVISLFVCSLFGFLFEGAVLTLSFIVTTQFFFKIWIHAKTPIQCASLTIFIIYHLASGAARFDISIFASALYGVGAGWAAYEIRVRLDTARKNDAIIRRADEITLEAATEKQIIFLCKMAKMRKRDIDFTLKAFIEDLALKELAEIFKCSPEAASKRKGRIRAKLNAQISQHYTH